MSLIFYEAEYNLVF